MPFTEKELSDMIEHLDYELWMLAETAELLSIQTPGVVENALIDSFVIHGRSVREFLFEGDKSTKRDRIHAWDYVPDWARLRSKTGGRESALLDEFRTNAHRYVAHLLNGRRLKLQWSIEDIRDDLLKFARIFADSLYTERGWTVTVPSDFRAAGPGETICLVQSTSSTTSPASVMKPYYLDVSNIVNPDDPSDEPER